MNWADWLPDIVLVIVFVAGMYFIHRTTLVMHKRAAEYARQVLEDRAHLAELLDLVEECSGPVAAERAELLRTQLHCHEHNMRRVADGERPSMLAHWREGGELRAERRAMRKLNRQVRAS